MLTKKNTRLFLVRDIYNGKTFKIWPICTSRCPLHEILAHRGIEFGFMNLNFLNYRLELFLANDVVISTKRDVQFIKSSFAI